MHEFSLAGFAKFVAEEMPGRVHEARIEALKLGAELIEAEAKRVSGVARSEYVAK